MILSDNISQPLMQLILPECIDVQHPYYQINSLSDRKHNSFILRCVYKPAECLLLWLSSYIFTGETARELMDRLSWNLLLKNFTNIYWQFQFTFRLSNFNDCITKILHVFLCISQMQVTKYLSERKIFWAEVVDKNEKHFMSSALFEKVQFST